MNLAPLWLLCLALGLLPGHSGASPRHSAPDTLAASSDHKGSTSSVLTYNASRLPWENCQVFAHPKEIKGLKVGTFRWVSVNCTCCGDESRGIFSIMVYTTNRVVATPSSEQHNFMHRQYLEPCDFGPECGAHLYLPDHHSGFFVGSNQVGHIKFIVDVVWWDTNSRALVFDRRKSRSLSRKAGFATEKITILTLRHRKAVDFGFEMCVAFIACMTGLSAGCMTEVSFLRRNLRRPLPLILALVCQHLLVPGIVFGTLVGVKLSSEHSFGMFATVTVPGGGLAHLTVYLMDGDRELSTAISLANAVLSLVLAPTWLFAFTWYVPVPMNYPLFILWLGPTIGSVLIGFALRYYKPSAADAVMTWFTRPLLLLSGILLSTLGVYINHYTFDYIDYRLVLVALCTVFGGFLLGGIVGFVSSLGKPRRKTLAAETSVFNCLIVIVALRYSLAQPTADLASSAPLWGCFFTPAPIILYFVSHKIKAWILNFIEKRKEKQYRHYSIVSSFAKMAEDVTAVSAPLALDGPSAEESSTPLPPPRTDCDQKVTSV